MYYLMCLLLSLPLFGSAFTIDKDRCPFASITDPKCGEIISLHSRQIISVPPHYFQVPSRDAELLCDVTTDVYDVMKHVLNNRDRGL